MSVQQSYATYTVSAVAAYGLYRLVKFLTASNPLANLPGPSNPSLLLGHNHAFRNAIQSDSVYDIIEGWVKEYGHVVGYRELLSVTIAYILCLRRIS
jgi:hypothetical protein